MPRALRLLAPLAGLVLLAATLAGCGSSSPGTTASTDSSGATTIDITIKGGTVKPSGAAVKVKRGATITLKITADKAGELHVHSSPEQHVDFDAGTSEKTLKIDQPGVVDVEDHALDKLIVQLEVS